jgi:RNA polymerase sigma-70 factor, ECF subfamily
MDERTPEQLTELLARVAGGDESGAATLVPVVYRELRALAGHYFRQQRPDQTLQPTALVHEAFLKLVGSAGSGWESRAHFFAVAARAMRQILTDHARRRSAARRGGGSDRVTLSGLATPAGGDSPIGLLALDEALNRLAELSPRQARIVEMRFLAGLDEKEVAHVLAVTTRTVQREWRVARAFLRAELGEGDSS